MTYRIIVSSRAEKDLKKLPSTVIPKIKQTILNLADEPRPRGAIVLKAFHPETWRIGVGEWRILYRIDDQIHILNITWVLHRREAYRKS